MTPRSRSGRPAEDDYIIISRPRVENTTGTPHSRAVPDSEDRMIQETVDIVNELGLHARAASKFVNTASGYLSLVKLSREDKPGDEVDGKSILGVLLLAASIGTRIVIRVDGEDEQKAMESLKSLVANGFGEMADDSRNNIP